jgi:uncharacterized membrane protein YbhN (UPF0104 family)
VATGFAAWSPVEAGGVYTVMQLVGGLSPLPQGLAVTEGIGAVLLTYLGIDSTQAIAAILVFRAATLGLSASVGLLAFLLLRLTSPRVRIEQPAA